MKRHIYILIAAALAALTGCIQDTPCPGLKQAPDGSVNLNITVSNPVPRTLGGTRGVEDFYALNDVNIVVADGDDIRSIIFLPLGPSGPTTSLPGGVEYSARHDDFGIHFSKEWLEYTEIPAETATFFIVGNYGESLDVDTVEELRGLQIVSDIPGSPGSRNIMFGQSKVLDPDDPDHLAHIGLTGHENGRSLRVEMKRQAVMITLKIDGSGLSNNIEIVPTSISLHNVPLWSYLGKDNDIDGVTPPTVPSGGDNVNMAPVGESFSGALLNWGALGTMPGGTSPLGNTLHTVAGGHYTDGSSDGNTPNYARDDIHALFMLENIHGADFGAENAVNQSSGRGKRPWYVPWSATETAQNETALAVAANALACSYLEVQAEYYRYSGSQVVEGGHVAYRVFLGGDIYRNFDVRRNTYYRFTLDLNNGAIGEGDFSWRLDTDLSTTSALDESEFILNAAGEMIVIDELIANPNQSWYQVAYDDLTHRQVNGGNPYIYVMASSNSSNTGSWIALPLDDDGQLSGPDRMNAVTESGHIQYRLYVDPMTEEDGAGENAGYMRRLRFNFHIQNNTYVSDWITVTQYAPMVITVTGDDPRVTPAIEAQIAAAGKSLPMTVWFDRVDRAAKPWGFDGAAIPDAPGVNANPPVSRELNPNSGLDNGIRWLYAPGADGYLPFGEGSAMMHAAYLNYYQWEPRNGFTTLGGLSPSPGMLAMRTYVENNPTFPVVPNAIPSRQEWKLLEMLDEAGFGVFDRAHGHDIIPWQPYWTSDAVESNTAESYAYRRNSEATDGIITMERTAPISYRLVYFDE